MNTKKIQAEQIVKRLLEDFTKVLEQTANQVVFLTKKVNMLEDYVKLNLENKSKTNYIE